MRERSLGVTALAVASVIIGVYSLVGGIAFMIAGVFGTAFDVSPGSAVMWLAALFLGLSAAALFVGGAFWLQKPLAWAGGMVVFSALIAVNVLAVILGSGIVGAILPVIVAAGAMVYLARPQIKAELLGSDSSAEPDPALTDRTESKVAETTA